MRIKCSHLPKMIMCMMSTTQKTVKSGTPPTPKFQLRKEKKVSKGLTTGLLGMQLLLPRKTKNSNELVMMSPMMMGLMMIKH